ncbi:MAG: RsmG family class I SAM-dependent methyltransferase [Ilumatobacteraceae bacterium]
MADHTPDSEQLLLDVLQSLRERGAIGESSLIGAVAHAAAFVGAIPPTVDTLLDLGSGGGLPGLVIAVRLPHLSVTLTDRRERRMDLLVRACARLGISDRATVLTGDVRALAKRSELDQQFDVVTARAFGAPEFTLACARPFLRFGGILIVSDPPPSADVDPRARWVAAGMDRHGFEFSGPSLPQMQVLIKR